MESIFRSVLVVFLVLGIFGVSSFVNSELDLVGLCDDDFNCIYNLGVSLNDSSVCEGLKGDDVGFCYEDLAYVLKDSDLCGFVFNSSNCYENLAIDLGDVSICKDTSDFDLCVFRVAVFLNDSSVCDQGDDVGKCFYSFAVASGDERFCEKSLNHVVSCDEWFLN